MYIHSNFTGNPTKTTNHIPYYPIRIRRKLEEGEVEPNESTTNNTDFHTMIVSKDLATHSRFRCARDATYLGF